LHSVGQGMQLEIPANAPVFEGTRTALSTLLFFTPLGAAAGIGSRAALLHRVALHAPRVYVQLNSVMAWLHACCSAFDLQ
jgi:hypothetical protein